MKLKNTPFLKLIILYKTVMGTSELILSTYLYTLYWRDPGAVFTTLVGKLHLDFENIFIKWALGKAGNISDGTLFAMISVICSFGVFNLIEAWGLHLRRRWGEWLTVLGTGALIPFEAYELARSFSFITLVVLIINSLIVYYLAKHKELFKSKGEKKAV